MADEPIQAIITLWDSNSLDDDFAGGVWSFQAPNATATPYVVITPVDVVPLGWTSSRGIEQERVQFSIFYEETASADPVTAINTLGRTLRAVYNDARLTMTGTGAGTSMHMRFAGSALVKETEKTYHLSIDYLIARAKAS